MTERPAAPASLSRRAALQGLTGIAMATSWIRSRPQRPHIVLIMADQLRADCIGASGNGVIATPNVDRLAAEGTLFRRAYTSTPSCTPARTGLLTGLAPWRHGMLGYGQMAVTYANEMPRMLGDAGYATVGIGKMHYHPQRNLHGFERTILDESGRVESAGFESDYRAWFRSHAPGRNPDATGLGWNDYAAREYALPEELHPTAWTGDRAVEAIDGYRDDRPLFLKVSFARPHSPYDPPARLMRRYVDAPVRAAVAGEWSVRHAHHGETLRADTWWGNLGTEQVRLSRRAYYGSVEFIDEQVGRILDALDRMGMSHNAVVVFTADHGDMLGDHNLWRKTYPYEGSARIPLIVRWPESVASADRARSVSQCVELRDILPTFLEIAGARVDTRRFDGRSLAAFARSARPRWRSVIDLEHSRCYFPDNDWNALTDGHMKYVWWGLTGEEQLFDLGSDPNETRDLAPAAAHRALIRQWRSRMVAHLSVRGEEYVRNGELVVRTTPRLYSPNHPRG